MAELPENEYLIDLYDEDGNKKVFEHLDTVLYKNDEYVICIPYDEEESEVSEIVIFRTVEDENGESALEQVLESDVLSAVYDVFRDRNADKFDFQM
ncbi:MAG: DUF1292 domain-containing protein [Clostridia bacterium]|nr:DUF1292 domain-containing protein [Clostridia bacterium]